MIKKQSIGYFLGGILCLFFNGLVQAQTCNIEMTQTAPDSQYHNNGNGTVTDRKRGLMWQQCSIGQSGINCQTGTPSTFTWDQALQYPQALNTAGGFLGFTDWRLPNVKELRSLVEEACNAPTINANLFPNSQKIHYWSSSPYAYTPYYDAWGVSFNLGNSDGRNRTERNHVRLVRTKP